MLLLIDDEQANLDLLEAFLLPEGHDRLVMTTDAREAIALFDEHRPDIVLLDLHMPFRSGFEILEDVRARTPGEFLPVLVLTADVTPGARERALRSGAQDFLTKPLDAIEVVLRVRNLLATRSLHLWQKEELEAAERRTSRAIVLAESSRVLQSSLDATTALEALADVLVPAFVDTCRIESTSGASIERLAGSASTSAVRADMVAGGRSLGTIHVSRVAGHPPLDADGAELIAEIARRAGQALENVFLISEAQRAARARDHVLSVVAHDLRNPLTAIAANAEMIRQLMPADLDVAHVRALKKIEDIAWRTHRMVEDLLELSRLDQRPFVLRPGVVEIPALFGEAESMLQVLATKRAITLTFEGPADLPPVVADGPRLSQVLSNLVGNALKFTPAGGRVVVDWRATDDGIIVRVTDSGPGIPVDRVPELFRPFWQADPSDRRGVGLGLTIARAIVEAHGGRIWVESPPDSGASFRFTIPMAPQGAHPATNGVEPQE